MVAVFIEILLLTITGSLSIVLVGMKFFKLGGYSADYI
jgi:hypothetical protein